MSAVAKPESVAIGSAVEQELLAQFGTAPLVRRLAAQASRFLDLADQAAATVAAEGLVLVSVKGTFRHPALEVERTMRLAYLSAVRVLESPRRGKVGQAPMGERLPQVRGGAEAGRASRFFKPSA